MTLILVAGVAGLILVAMELMARCWIHRWSRYYVLPPGMRLRLRPDPDGFPQLESPVRFEVNSEGERGDEVPRRRDGLYRILVAGGSQPEGYLLDQHTTWPGALHRLLQDPTQLERLRARRVHVGNVARSGAGSEALDLILARVLPRYDRLDTIIVLVGASDVLHWLELGAPPSPPPPVRASDVFAWHPELTFDWRIKRLALLELLGRARQRWLRPVQVNDRTCKWVVKARSMRARASEILTDTPDPSPMLAHFDHHFRRALMTAKAHADRVMVVRQPWFDKHCTPEEAALMWHGGIGRAWREEVTRFYSLEVLSRLMALVDASASDAARELNVEELDLMPILEPSATTYYDFFHATPAGARAIAAAVTRAILRESRCEPFASRATVASTDVSDVEELTEKVS